jgi:hypothetical protein
MNRTRVFSMLIATFTLLGFGACERRAGDDDTTTVRIQTGTDTVRDTIRDTVRDTVRP